MLLRLLYLTLTSMFTLIRLLPRSDHDKDAEILALRHQLTVLQRQTHKPKLTWPDRALLAALLHSLPRVRLRQLHLIVSPDTVLHWHRELLRRRHAKASRPKRPGRPRTVRSIRALVLRLARENSSWGYRRIHGELAALGIKLAAGTVWNILKEHGIDPTPERDRTTWATFLRSQAQSILAADFFETKSLTGATLYVLAVIEHATRRVRTLGATAQVAAAKGSSHRTPRSPPPWQQSTASTSTWPTSAGSARRRSTPCSSPLRTRRRGNSSWSHASVSMRGRATLPGGRRPPATRSSPHSCALHRPLATAAWSPCSARARCASARSSACSAGTFTGTAVTYPALCSPLWWRQENPTGRLTHSITQ
ncbi:hypothetical protein [Streptomyces violaceusniger]|uniref:hypothetical protein n=1 Tax=Streptomyces violaceusniger TaxID=68280 RepID=UPI002072C9E1|nr:hypothetical protein [Streptomyces violaceusniger]